MPRQTIHEFTLPWGIELNGVLHREGTMRLATGADEILPQGDMRVQNNPAYLMIIVLSRVVTRLGSIPMITTQVIESLYTEDMNFLIDMYSRINKQGSNTIPAVCPKCQHSFHLEVKPLGE